MENNHSRNKKNNDSSNALLALGVGLLAGAALGYYLNSNEGRRMRSNVASEFNEYGEQIGGIATEAGKLAANYANEAKFQGQEFARSTRGKAENLASAAKENMNAGKDWVQAKTQAVKSSVVG